MDQAYNPTTAISTGFLLLKVKTMSQGERRLAAIMLTDMVGYTTLTQKNEQVSMELLAEHNALLRATFPKFGGREVKAIGDSFLVEFPSALEAVRCAMAIQQHLRERNQGVLIERNIQLRVGVHTGDVITANGDIFGDAVNISSRIEPLAEPGGVCISEQVYNQVRNKLDLEFVKLESPRLKNVTVPVDVYRVVMPWTRGEPAPRESTGKTGFDRNRVAILPFVNMSANREDDFFADGLTEELISTTSSITGLTLIARTSVMRFKGTSKGIEEIGRELSVGTILEGSVRKAGNKLRITVQLIDAQSQGHLWAQSYDRELDDVFAVQSDIAKKVTDALRVRMLPGEALQVERRRTKSAQAYTLYLKGRFYWNERSEPSLLKAIEYFKQAIKIDPEYALAYSGIADCFIVLGNHRYLPFAEAYSQAKENAMKAVQFDDGSAEAHTSLGWALFAADYDWKEAEKELRKASELNPSYATGHHWYGTLLLCQGRLGEALREGLRAEELDPLSPQIPSFCALIYAYLGEFEQAEGQIRKVFESEPEFIPAHTNLRWIYVVEGKYDLAELEAREVMRLTGDRPEEKGFLAVIYAFAGRAEDARKVLEEVGGRMYNYYLILVYLGLGETERAIELVEKEYQGHADWLGELAYGSLYEKIRSDDRVVAVLRKVGLEPGPLLNR